MHTTTSARHLLSRSRAPADPRSALRLPVVVIPVHQPQEALDDLVRELRRRSPETPVVVVDDGSGVGVGGRYAVVLDRVHRLGAEVVRHQVSRGRGQALKTGLAHVAAHHPGHPVVCVDLAGQPLVRDILTIGVAVAEQHGGREIVLGGASRGEPGASRAGAERQVVAYPAALIGWLLQIRGSRASWERRALRKARSQGVAVRQVPLVPIPPSGPVPRRSGVMT